MSLYGQQGMKLTKFGGLNTLINPTNLPIWASPDCPDVEFFPGLVKTRPGLSVQIGNLGGGTVKVSYLKTYINSLLQHRMLAFTPGITSLSNSGGVLYKENPQGTMNVVSQTISSNYCTSCSAFTREYLAFGDGMFGIDIPRQFDDTNLDRVSQEGPGQAPSAQDETTPLNITASPTGLLNVGAGTIIAAPNGATEVGNIVTITATSATGILDYLRVGDTVQIAGVAVGGYNGTFPILSISPDYSSFTYFNPTTGLAASGGGTFKSAIYQVIPTAAHNIPLGSGVGNSVPPGLVITPTITIAGAGIAGYNGTWDIRGVLNATILLIIIPGQFALAASGGGTMTINGNIVAGLHQISVMFVWRSGYITRPAPPLSFTAGGGKRAFVFNIPIGPPGVVSRILIFTALSGDNFFYIPDSNSDYYGNMVIPDNSTTSTYVDFSDQLLLTGVVADRFFDLEVLGESLGNVFYSSRLFWWGERNQLQNVLSFGFDGGFTNPGSSPNFPLGWIQDASLNSGGASAVAQGLPAYSGDAYAIIGNGVAATRGKITQTMFQDYLGNPVLNPSTSYSVRVRLAKNSTLSSGAVHININSVIGGYTTTGISVAASSLATWYQEFTAVILSAQPTIPTDIIVQVYADGTPTNNGAFLIDNIEIYPTNHPFTDASTIRASGAEDPESYDGVSGFLQVSQGDGTRVTNAFVIRNNLYFTKERSLHVTQDDGTNEPNQWTIQKVSEKVGTLSVKGIGTGDEWVVIASQSGLWLFEGGILTGDRNLAKEIQPTWDSINWQFGYLVEVVVDTSRKRIYVSVPFGSSTVQNKILTLDYTEGFGEQQDGVGRKWSPWAIQAASMNLILRDDESLPLFIGNGAGNGAIYKLDEAVISDDGSAIDGFWQSGYFQDGERLNFGYVSANVVGSGQCLLTLFKGGQQNKTQIRGWTLNQLEFNNMERQIQKQGFRMSIKVETNATTAFFSLQSLTMYANPTVYAPVRGINA